MIGFILAMMVGSPGSNMRHFVYPVCEFEVRRTHFTNACISAPTRACTHMCTHTYAYTRLHTPTHARSHAHQHGASLSTMWTVGWCSIEAVKRLDPHVLLLVLLPPLVYE